MKRKHLLAFCALFLFASLAIAQDTKPITWKDIPTWKYMPGSAFQLSPDGQWMAYGLVQLEGDGEIILQKVSDESTKKTFKIGSTNFPSMQFSEDGKWFAYTEYPTFSQKQANEKSKGKPLKNKAFLIKLGTDDKIEFENVSNYGFNGKASTVLAVNLSKEGNGNGGDVRGSDLLIYHLNSEKSQNLGNVADFPPLSVEYLIRTKRRLHLRFPIFWNLYFLSEKFNLQKSLRSSGQAFQGCKDQTR